MKERSRVVEAEREHRLPGSHRQPMVIVVVMRYVSVIRNEGNQQALGGN